MDNSKLVKIITNENKSKLDQELMEQFDIDSEALNKKTALKRKWQEENGKKHDEEIQEEAQSKSLIKQWMELKRTDKKWEKTMQNS